MTRYMIYFEPMELDADNLEDAEIQSHGEEPKILKIIPTEFLFDLEPKKEKVA